jgi:septal ring-binding cell division protein DamX
MVERMLATETNFFDHHRLRNLGGQAEAAPISAPTLLRRSLRPVSRLERLTLPEPPPPELPALAGLKARPEPGSLRLFKAPEGKKAVSEEAIPEAAGQISLSPGYPKPGDTLITPADSPALPLNQEASGQKAESGAPAHEGANPGPPAQKAPGGLRLLKGGEQEAEAGPNEEIKASEEVKPAIEGETKPAEPRWLSLMKWLTRLCLSLIFLVWIFILGFLVGRGTVNEVIPGLGWLESKAGPADYQPAPEVDAELPPQASLPMVIVKPEGPKGSNPRDAQGGGPALGQAGSMAAGLLPYSGDSDLASLNHVPELIAGSKGADKPEAVAKPASESGLSAMAGQNSSNQGAARPLAAKPSESPTAAAAVAKPTPKPSAEGGASQSAASQSSASQSSARRVTAAEPTITVRAASREAERAAASSSDSEIRPAPAQPPQAQPAAARPAPPQPASAQPAQAQPAQAQPASGKPASAEDDSELFWPAKPERSGQYTVQVATANSEAEARTVTETYRRKGFEAYYYRTSSGRYPIRVGRYATEEQAKIARAALASAGAQGPYVSKLKN